MIDTSIIQDEELLERAKQIRRDQKREYSKEWRRAFKRKYGIDYNTYLLMKKAKESRDYE